MSSRTALAVIAAALIFGAIGYYYGKLDPTEEPFAAPATVTAAAAGAPTCRATALVVYDPRQVPMLWIVAGPDKRIEVLYPESAPSEWAVCWELEVRSGDPDPFRQLKVELTRNQGYANRPILRGDPNFRGNRGVRLDFDDEPVWSGSGLDEYVMGYEVRGRLRGTDTEIVADPDLVIKKPGG